MQFSYAKDRMSTQDYGSLGCAQPFSTVVIAVSRNMFNLSSFCRVQSIVGGLGVSHVTSWEAIFLDPGIGS